MTDVTTIYVCTRYDHPFQMLGPDLVPLSRSFRERKDEPTTDFIKEYLMCPALTDTMKDTFVIPSPLDLQFIRDEKGELNVQAGGPLANQDFFWNKTYTLAGQSENSVQFLSDHFISVFADKPAILELTPPYMHSSKLYGFAGRYDIHSWLRPLSFVLERFQHIIDRCTRYKGVKEKSSLRELYNVFNSSRQKSKLLKLLRELSE